MVQKKSGKIAFFLKSVKKDVILSSDICCGNLFFKYSKVITFWYGMGLFYAGYMLYILPFSLLKMILLKPAFCRDVQQTIQDSYI